MDSFGIFSRNFKFFNFLNIFYKKLHNNLEIVNLKLYILLCSFDLVNKILNILLAIA